MKAISLCSSSDGNSLLVWSEDVAIIIDAGISVQGLKKKLALLNIKEKIVKALLLTHEHLDHSKYVYKISSSFNIPVYLNKPTFTAITSRNKYPQGKVKFVFFEPNKIIKLYNFLILPVPVTHDAVSPVGFVVKYGNYKLSYFVDIARVDKTVWQHITKSHLVIIDSNYDRQMLINGTYPLAVKKRIVNNAHLSNETAANIIINHPNKYMTEFWLAHLSRENNSENVAKKTVYYVINKAGVNKTAVNFKILPAKKLGPLWSTEKYSQLTLPLKIININEIFKDFYSNLTLQQKEKFDAVFEKVKNIEKFCYEKVQTSTPNEYAWRVTSTSDPNEIYVVARDVQVVGIIGVKFGDKVWSCECADFIFRCQKLNIPCKHILKIILELAKQK